MRTLKYFIPCLLLTQSIYSMEESLADKVAYENHKRNILRQAYLLLPYADQFFACFASNFPDNALDLQIQYQRCEKLYDKLKKDEIIKLSEHFPCTEKSQKTCQIHNRLYLEINLLYNAMSKKSTFRLNKEAQLLAVQEKVDYLLLFHGMEYPFNTNVREKTPGIGKIWKQAVEGIRNKRKITLDQWPTQQRKKFPHLAIAAFLNEIQCPLKLLDKSNPYINPQDFVELKNQVD